MKETDIFLKAVKDETEKLLTVRIFRYMKKRHG